MFLTLTGDHKVMAFLDFPIFRSHEKKKFRRISRNFCYILKVLNISAIYLVCYMLYVATRRIFMDL